MNQCKEKTKISTYLLLMALIGLISCRTTVFTRPMEVEIMKPASFILPDKIDTIAVFKRDLSQSDTMAFQAVNGDNPLIIKDIPVPISSLSNICVETLANSLEEEGYFRKVINYSDSLNYLFLKDSMVNYPALHKSLGADVFVFLDFFNLQDLYAESKHGSTFFMSIIKEDFPEFQASSRVERIEANLMWTFSFRDDTAMYTTIQPDFLYYGNSVYPEFFGNDSNHKLLLENTAEYLGKAFAKKIIPSWEKVYRNYYRSRNLHMLEAEKYLLDNDWLKAAEIYQKETDNKNRNIAAKARFNMALICEMEGKFDAATDWLERSKSTYKNGCHNHLQNCEEYLNQIALRNAEIKMLEKQVARFNIMN